LAIDERSRASRARAEHALVELGIAFGKHAQELIVIGGLNPDFLAPAAPVPHLGTTDVDILLELGFNYDRDDLNFSWLEPALRTAGFLPMGIDAWQWKRNDHDAIVRIDILCDVADSPDQKIALPGATDVTAKNLAGPSGALSEPVTRTLDLDDESRRAHPDAPTTVTLRFASLGGYLLAKASACVGRGLTKDAYDLMFVVLYNELGPQGAGDAIAQALKRPAAHHNHRADTIAALGRFDPPGTYSAAFADQMQLSGDDSTNAQLINDARRGAQIVREMLTEL